jgi:hypothetical protein
LVKIAKKEGGGEATLHEELHIFKSISRDLRDKYNKHGSVREADKTVNYLNIALCHVDAICQSRKRGKNSKAPQYYITLTFPSFSPLQVGKPAENNLCSLTFFLVEQNRFRHTPKAIYIIPVLHCFLNVDISRYHYGTSRL